MDTLSSPISALVLVLGLIRAGEVGDSVPPMQAHWLRCDWLNNGRVTNMQAMVVHNRYYEY
eukprot:688670-Amphidinium_carterae.2